MSRKSALSQCIIVSRDAINALLSLLCLWQATTASLHSVESWMAPAFSHSSSIPAQKAGNSNVVKTSRMAVLNAGHHSATDSHDASTCNVCQLLRLSNSSVGYSTFSYPLPTLKSVKIPTALRPTCSSSISANSFSRAPPQV